MKPTAGQLLASPALAGARLLGGAGGMYRMVSDVYAYDTEVGVEGSALVLGRPDGYQLELLLPRARAAGASLIIVHSPAEDVLSSTRWLADRLDLPLIAVSEPDEPLELAQQLHALVHGDETRRGLLCATVARQLGSRRTSPAEIVRVLAQLLSVRCAVLGPNATTLAGEGPSQPLDKILRGGAPVTLRNDTGAVVAVPAGAVGTQPVSLWLVAESGNMTDAELATVAAVLHIASWAVTAWSASQQLEAARDTAFQTVVLTELLTAGDQVSPQTVEHAVEAGWQWEGWHIGVRVLPTDTAARRRQAVTSVLNRVLADNGLSGPLVELGDSWATWYSQRDEPSPERFREIVTGARKALGTRHAVELVAGIGRAQQGPAGLARSLAEASELARIAGLSPGRRRVEHASASDPRRLVLAAVSADETVQRSNRLLGPLLAPDNTVLLDTLETYLSLESSTSATAVRLSVHRNTVFKRLERIERLLGVRLDDAAIRFALRIACRAVR